jgi:hypothetical protein
MNTLVQQKHKNNEVEVECSMLKNMVINISNFSHSIASNHIMSTIFVQEDPEEEDKVH